MVAAVLALPTVSFGQVKVIISGGFTPAYQELLPEFERTTGITVTTASGASQGSGPNTIGAQLRRGVPADVVIMSKEGLADLKAEGKILAGSDVDLAQTPIGMAVRTGMPKPDISTVDAFTQTLLRAKAVVVPGSTTGIYLTTKVFPRLDVAKTMTVKITQRGSEAAALVAAGDADLVIQPVSELLHASGVDFVDTIPTDLQYISVFTGAVVAGSRETDAAKQLIAFLSSENANIAIKRSGMAPARRQ
jgi:molybdate transport system substrate-binding protein